jgi:hypothetical protein
LNKEIVCNFAIAHALIAQQMHTELQLIEEQEIIVGPFAMYGYLMTLKQKG